MKIVVKTEAPKKFQKFGKLPGKPSELIRVALKDLRAAEKAKNLKIDMGHWVAKKPDGVCTVCMAGAVMMNLDGPAKFQKRVDNTFINLYDETLPAEVSTPSDFQKEEAALDAINSLRSGHIAEAFDALQLEVPEHFVSSVKVINYSTRNREKFKKQMTALAKALENEGY